MKSIMEEASSIGKAIEQAWSRAGKPTNFTIKIFEEAKKNLFGFTSQSAKIGLFFDGKSAAHAPYHRDRHPAPAPKKDTQPQRPTTTTPSEKPKRASWSDDMVGFAKQWVQQALNIMGLPDIQFSVSVAGNIVKIHFGAYITGKEGSDRMLFSSFAHLIMTALRQKYKKSLYHMKVVLTSNS